MAQRDTNPYNFSDSNKRYYTYDYFLKQKFGTKCAKISLNGGFSCPNIDGKVGYGGCIYCSDIGSGEFNQTGNIKEQFEKQKAVYERKWGKTKYIVYFQAHTNTYAPVEKLRDIYYRALDNEDVVGISIATRADELADDVCSLLCEISKETFLTVELGLQSCHDETAKRINRCHTTGEFVNSVNKLREFSQDIRICAHIINGLPGETVEMMLDTARFVSNMGLDGVKIHSLSVLKNSALGALYKKQPFDIMSFDEYISLVVSQLELLSPDIVVERLTSDPDRHMLLAPDWALNKTKLLNGIDKMMYEKNTFQGRLYGV